MRKQFGLGFAMLFILSSPLFSQEKNTIIDEIVKEVYENSHLESLGHELMDDIGPRLVGTPQMQQAHDWAVAKYKSCKFTSSD